MPSILAWHRKVNVSYSITAWEINQAYYFDAFMAQVIEGRQRIGKSSYGSKAMAQAFGEWTLENVNGVKEPRCVKSNFEEVKPWMTFLPKEYLQIIMDVVEKERGLILDDAGIWLYSLDWYDPFVKSVNKWMQVGGTRFGTLLMTTPNKRLISGKVLEALPDLKVCRISKIGYDSLYSRPRLARVYEVWDYPDGKRGGVKTMWEDKFNAMLPNDYYAWYKPKREQYVDVALRLMQSDLVKAKQKYEGMSVDEKIKVAEREGIMEDVHKVVGDPEQLAEVDEVIKILEREKLEQKVIQRI